MIDNDLKELLSSLIEEHKSLIEEHKKTELAQQKTEAAQQKTEAAQQRTEIAQQRTEVALKKLSKQLGGIGNNNGEYAEQYFYRSLRRVKSLNGINFHVVSKNLKNTLNNIEDEYDIALINDNTIAVVEVKYKFHPDDVDKFYKRKLPNFKTLFPMYGSFTLFGAIAGFALPDDTIQKAKEYGLYVLTKSGKEIEILNNEVRSFN